MPRLRKNDGKVRRKVLVLDTSTKRLLLMSGRFYERRSYNCNIANQQYTNYAAIALHSYDKLNRLYQATVGNSLGELISYDAMGNITGLTRDGYGTNSYHTYQGNRLMGISGFTNATYTYDDNGNLKTDNGKGISLTYNYLNLPQSVSGSQNVTYKYNAAGMKLKKQSSLGTSDYVGGIQYKNGVIETIQTEEGVARNGSGYIYEYNISDHLGNVRTTFYYNTSQSAINVLQRDDYYAFGLRKPVLDQTITSFFITARNCRMTGGV